MSNLPNGEYLLTNVQWHKADESEAYRPLHGFTTGKLIVSGGSAALSARFNDQFLSNRLSDLEEDGVPIVLRVMVLEAEEAFTVSCSAPTLDRSGASYELKARGEFVEVEDPAV